MRFENLDASTLEQIGTPEARSAARLLVENQQVQHGYRIGDRLQIVVWDEEPFSVEVRIRDGQLTSMCPCTQVEGQEVCPHVLALLWSWVEEPEKFLNRGELKERLKKYSKKDLLDIILDLADRVPEVRSALKEEGQGLDDILESIDRLMEEVSGGIIDPAEAEERLRRTQSWADRLAQAGQLSDARAIYFYLLDNLLGLEERLHKEHLFPRNLTNELFEEYCQLIHEDRQLERDLVQQELEQLENRQAVRRGDLNLSDIKQEFFAKA